MGPDLLVLAAFPPELAPLASVLGDDVLGDGARLGAWTVSARTVGIGLPAAAAGTSARLAEGLPRAVVLVGTCGAYARRALAVGDVVVARRVRLVDPSSLDGATAMPEPMTVVVDPDAGLAEALGAIEGVGPKAADVATTLGITIDDAVAARIAETTGADVEHLEAFGVATACAARGVPFTALLGVANVVGSNARSEWRANHRRASAAAIDVLLRAVRASRATSDDALAAVLARATGPLTSAGA